jgi:hypothetical protein
VIFHLNNRRKEKLESFVSISIIIIRFPFFYTLIRYAGALQCQCSSAPFSTVNKKCFFGQVSALYTFFGCPWNESFFLVPQVIITNMDTLLLSNAFRSKFVIFCISSKGGFTPQSIFHVLC